MNQKELARWIKDKGDDTLAVDFDLTDISVVVDTAGVSGIWAEKIYNKYGCNIYIFEPARRYHKGIVKKFQGKEKVVPLKAMLSSKSEKSKIYLKEEASSSYSKVSEVVEDIDLMDISEFRRIHQINMIDLLLLNANGEEYNIFERMFEKMIHKKVKYILVQFSSFVTNAKEKRESIRSRLSKTHDEVFNYEFVWECWKLR